ncbi:beta-ketoacyl-[acyl-carrier-protein] synthase family protein [Actinoplanes teichomyceticus]|uniref:3-oxoacyl-[acyl-carrier-protein] synthase II n=1 Tax=Actinoplanes teichomyceticus TaxID=1867 RepID=A0A561WLQ0_ACTTI|nr:beta-ketoacyl-[acyl-carrier-protein] synthase family protein [Actinoplanes teichomyceticus]TWG24792.1 3-oxoacyl-[acyl-carrier-protein] synthase II [Actinoplanes teichomyceticus]GIF14546.1 3-oxoacyl-[acyl-carrier-protein] synthase 2 [Actinoplanes teichomyceticus]
MPAHRVAVTGLGLVTPAGIGVTETWERILDAEPTAAHDPELADNPVTISCRVPGFDGGALLGRRARKMDRFTQFAVVAATEALADAGLDPARWDGARVAVVLGNADGGFATVEQQHSVLTQQGAGFVSALLLPMQLSNMLAGQLSLQFGATGPSFCVATACASGTTAIGLACDLLRLDRCDVVITGGSEALVTPLIMAGFARMGALSRRAGDPREAMRPFEVERDGFVGAEGAGILVLERLADARARGAGIRATVDGTGHSADAHHLTAPDPEGRGLERAIRAALADADAGAGDIDHVNAHGTATPLGDLAESRAVERVLRSRPLVSSTKGVTGHMLGAAGAVEAALTVLAVQHGVVPPTANLDRQDPEVEVEVATKPVHRRLDAALSLSAGFGGQNAAVLVRAI